jgi:hypothetical protein
MTTRTRLASTPAYYLGRPAALWLTASRRQPATGTSPLAPDPGQAREHVTK